MWTLKGHGARAGRASRLAPWLLLGGAVAGAQVLAAGAAPARAKDPPPENAAAAKAANNTQETDTVTIHIEVTGGDKDKPIEAASIYIRYTEAHKHGSGHQAEMNVKTTPEGKARVPYVPRGKVVIQVIAEGWRTFGREFEITQDEQVIKIHLDKPHKWY